MKLKKNCLEELKSNDIKDLAEFVVVENYNHHSDNNRPVVYVEEVTYVHNEECKFFENAKIFVSKNILGNIEGTIRVLKWNYNQVLPIQKIFGINPLEIVGTASMKTIWHIGRFAIKKGSSDVGLFKKLMVCAISPICDNENDKGVAFAECDSKLLRVLRILGIEATVIGDAVNYLGSETIPVFMDYNGLIGFYKKNKHLIILN